MKTLKKKLTKYPAVLVITAILILSILFLGAWHFYPTKTVEITLTSSGFTPQSVSIKKGDKVRFITNSGNQFWPASDLHPTHTIYSEFDPKQPIEPNESWTFQFTREGKWSYHDHLNPIFRGTIIVGDQTESVATIDQDKCKNNQPGFPKQKCWGDLMDSVLKTQGLDQAFALMDHLYQTEPAFAADCHDYAHRLGQKGYEVFKSNAQVVNTNKTSYCGYGFYHSFMEYLLRDTQDIKLAQNYCNTIGATSNDLTKLSCFHGIGHGLLEDIPNPHLADKNVLSLIQKPLQICEEISTNEIEKERCASGVFNVVALYYQNPKSGVVANNSDPFAVCKSQQKNYQKRACYDQMNTLILFLSNHDLSKAFTLAQTGEAQFMQQAIHGVVGALGQADASLQNPPPIINQCNTLSVPLQKECIEAYVQGLIEGGKPGKEYQAAHTFCTSQGLTSNQKDICFQQLGWLIKTFYAPDKQKSICGELEPGYQKYCQG